MKGDLPAAAFRLMAQLPVRTVSRSSSPKPAALLDPSKRLRPVIINHRRFESLTEASRVLKISREAIRYMIRTRDGARYA